MEENVIQIKSRIMRKNIIYAKKDYIRNPAICSYENGKYLPNIMDDSVITCDEIMDVEAKLLVVYNMGVLGHFCPLGYFWTWG